MPRFRAVVVDFVSGEPTVEQTILGDLADVVALDEPDELKLAGRLDHADAIMVYNTTLRTPTLARLTNCKLIVRCAVGFDNIDHAFARTRGIPVCNVPDYGTEEVADTAVGLMLALVRGNHFHNNRLQRGEGPWTYKTAAPISRLRGKVFGVVGLGRIGTAAALRAKAFGMDVVYFDPFKPDGYDKALGIRRANTLHDLLRQSLVVSVHTPLNDRTRNLIDAAAIAAMPRGSILINTARGAIVDAAAIPEAIARGQLAGAGIDVLPVEPPPADHPLLAAWRNPAHPCHDRVILTPHSAFYSEEGILDMRTKGAEEVRRGLLGEPLRNVVN
ncbi:MAG: C-terminal binding protein [Fimbriiglobus sp.]|jgi:D-3-phosphoglycerate dehydrogenase/C-terminal binding protein|nr:C-terminal binding protein [Fimbriiglobus sp.]